MKYFLKYNFGVIILLVVLGCNKHYIRQPTSDIQVRILDAVLAKYYEKLSISYRDKRLKVYNKYFLHPQVIDGLSTVSLLNNSNVIYLYFVDIDKNKGCFEVFLQHNDQIKLFRLIDLGSSFEIEEEDIMVSGHL